VNTPCKVPVILVGFLMKIYFRRQIFEKKSKYQMPSKSVQWEAEFDADKRMDMTKLIVALRYFANAPENS
jgi:endo-beta-N-acetylglucosaminidase D